MGNRTEKSPCYHTSQSLEMRELSHIAPFNGFTSVALTFNTVIPALQSRHCNPSGTDTFFLQALPAQCYASPVFVTANRWHQHTTQINVTIPTTMYGVAQKKTLSRLQNKNHGKPSNVGQNIFFHTARTDWKEVLATYGSDK